MSTGIKHLRNIFAIIMYSPRVSHLFSHCISNLIYRKQNSFRTLQYANQKI